MLCKIPDFFFIGLYFLIIRQFIKPSMKSDVIFRIFVLNYDRNLSSISANARHCFRFRGNNGKSVPLGRSQKADGGEIIRVRIRDGTYWFNP